MKIKTRILNPSQNDWPVLYPVVLFTVLICVFYSAFFKDLFNHPDYFYNTTGDGIKNYSTYLYHVKYDDSWWHYNGMNYPFGENLMYTDSQPIFTNFVKLLSRCFPFVEAHATAFYNFLMLFTWWLGGIALVILFKKMLLPTWYAVLAGFGIILLSPQILRMGLGHHSLFHPLFPFLFLFWYYLFKGYKTRLVNFLCASLLIIFGMIHPYQFALGLLICLLFTIFYTYTKKKLTKKLKFSEIVFVQLLLPIAVFLILSGIDNFQTDRTETPARFFIDKAYLKTIFSSYIIPYYQWLYNRFSPDQQYLHENYSYLGIVGGLFFIVTLATIIVQFAKNKFYFLNAFDPYEKSLLAITVVSLLIAIGFPFILPGGNRLLYYSGPFKEFRSVGRFGWIGFYSVNILATSFIYSWCQKRNWYLKKIIPLVAILILLGEAIIYNLNLERNLHDLPEMNGKYLPLSKNHVDSFQAILPNPYFHIGTENIVQWDAADMLLQSLQLSVAYGLPNLGSMQSRNSLHQAIQTYNISVLPFTVPEILRHLPSEKPILVVETKSKFYDKRYSLDWLTKGLPVIYENDEIRLKSLSLKQFKLIADSIIFFLNTTYQKQKIGKAPTSNFLFYYNKNWQQKTAVHNNIGFNLTDMPLKNLMVSVCFETKNIASSLVITQKDAQHNILNSFHENTGYWIRQINNEITLLEIPFVRDSLASQLELSLLNEEFEIPIEIKSAMIYKQGTLNFQEYNNNIYCNNYPFKKN